MTRRKSTSRKSSSSRSGSTKLTSAQKKLKEQQKAPWDRIADLGFANPCVYTLPWGADVNKTGLTYLSGIGYVGKAGIEHLQDYKAGEYSWLKYCTNRASGITTTPSAEGRAPQDYKLRKDQREDVITIIKSYNKKAPEFLIANDTGTGKTVTTWAAVKTLKPTSVLIVCPSAVIPSWRQHILDMGDGGAQVVIINYESTKKLIKPPAKAIAAKKTATQNKYIALEGEPYQFFDVVVFDEAHKLGNPTSQQSRVARSFADKARFTLRLTATPGKNPARMHHLWRGLSWVTGDNVKVTDDKDFSAYTRWCARHGIKGIVTAPFGNGIDWQGKPEELEHFHDIVYTPQNGKLLGIKRSPENWGATVRQALPLEITPQERKDYKLVVEDTKRSLLGLADKGRIDVAKGLAATMKLRQKTGMLKSPHVVDYAQYCIDDLGEQVVISAVFKNTVDVLENLLDEKKISYVTITGEQSKQGKEERRLEFQQGKVDVVITSITTGISLHSNEKASHATSAPRRMIIADSQYSPIEQKQLEGRINRNGEHGVITIPYLEDTVDKNVVSTVIKGMNSQSVMHGMDEEEQLHELAEALGIKI